MKLNSFTQYSLLFLACVFVAAACGESEQISEYQSGESRFTQGDTLQVSGILIDTHCYSLDKDNIGHDHHLPESGFREDCAEYCALQGYPVGVLDRNEQGDELWVIMTAAQIFADYMTQTVRVQGTVRSDGVLDPLRVELRSGPDEWVRIM